MHIFKAISALLFAVATFLSTAEAESIKYTKFGIGYAFQPGTTIVADELRLNSPSGPEVIELTRLPSACFAPPGITQVGEFDEFDGDNIHRVFRAWSLANIPITVTCGSKTVPVRVFFEASADGKNWVIFNNPAEAALNFQLWEHLEKRFSNTSMTVDDIDNEGIIRVRKRNGSLRLLFTVSQGLYFTGIPADEEGDQEVFMRILERGSHRVLAAANPTDAPFLTAVALEAVGFENISDAINTSINQALEMYIAQSEIVMDRLEGDLTRKYGPNWDQVLYDKHFGKN